ncbi:MAG: hypothetical protein ACLRNQ_06140 [Flavonifractor plautii]
MYRNVLEEPDCLADLPGNGDAFQFKGLTLAVYYAYEVQLFRNCPEELRDLYSDLRGRTLDAGILEDIRSGLPQRGTSQTAGMSGICPPCFRGSVPEGIPYLTGS